MEKSVVIRNCVFNVVRVWRVGPNFNKFLELPAKQPIFMIFIVVYFLPTRFFKIEDFFLSKDNPFYVKEPAIHITHSICFKIIVILA